MIRLFAVMANRLLETKTQAILDQIPYLDDDFEKAVAMMYQCQGKIIVTGVGKSGHVGAKIAATLFPVLQAHQPSTSIHWISITATQV